MTPAASGNNVFRTLARILVPVGDMNPMAIADSGFRQSKHIERSLLNMSQFLRGLRILSDQGTEFVNQDLEKHARQRGIHLATSPAHQPQSNGVAERLVGLAKQCKRRLLLAAGLPDLYWSYAMRFAAEMLRHKALGFQWHVPAFGEEVGVWRSHDKKQSAHRKGAVGGLIAIESWGNGTCVLIAKGSDLQDPELVHGLQPKTDSRGGMSPS